MDAELSQSLLPLAEKKPQCLRVNILLFVVCLFHISFSHEEAVVAKYLGRSRVDFKAFLKEH